MISIVSAYQCQALFQIVLYILLSQQSCQMVPLFLPPSHELRAKMQQAGITLQPVSGGSWSCSRVFWLCVDSWNHKVYSWLWDGIKYFIWLLLLKVGLLFSCNCNLILFLTGVRSFPKRLDPSPPLGRCDPFIVLVCFCTYVCYFINLVFLQFG